MSTPNLLSKTECEKAIRSWKEKRIKFSEIKTLINPSFIFSFSKDDCEWLTNNNESSTNFHAYIGVSEDNKLILIIVPLNKEGKEFNELTFYLITTLSPLKESLTLIETDTKTTTFTTNLSKDLVVTDYFEKTDLLTYNEPIITEIASVIDIELWKNNCLDWFYCECKNDEREERIVKAFNVPFTDLGKNNENGVLALFGFKNSLIYQRLIPILIFVAIKSKDNYSKILHSNTIGVQPQTNTSDYSQPCPPMCNDIELFSFLD